MSEQTPNNAAIKPLKSLSGIWFIPLIAVLIGAWMLYFQWSNQGPLISIEFKSAEGFEVGRTKIRARNVEIGELKSIRLNEQSDGVIITARMNKGASRYLLEDSHFWVVSPKISVSEVSGLSTLLSGVYIELAPGISKHSSREFEGLNDPPVTPLGAPGLHISLTSNERFAYSKGDPVIYKGLSVGKIEDISFDFEQRSVNYQAFIRAPFHQLITLNTRFWDVSGLSVDLNADGLAIKTGNLETLLTNGVAFGIPEDMPLGERITQHSHFAIFEDYQQANDQRFQQSAEYVILVSDTIRGLSVGAPVEYRGMVIGQVIDTNLFRHRVDTIYTQDIKIPVLVSMHPGRIGLPDNDAGLERMNLQTELFIKQGLKATLKSGNLLTGSLFVDLQHYPDQQAEHIEHYRDYPVIPSVSDELTQITAKASAFFDKLNDLPVGELSSNVNQLIVELTSTVKEFKQSSESLALILDDANARGLSEQLTEALKNIALLSQDLSADSTVYRQLSGTLTTLSDVMYELKPLLSELNKQPNGLIFNYGSEDNLQPTKASGE